MIVLSGGGAAWGLPEISPFVTKTEVHLQMAGLAYTKRQGHPDESPKGQIPYIDDGGRLIGDSTFIRFHIEREYGVDLDEGLDPAMAIEMMCEHELGPAFTYFRWLVPANFERGPGAWFDGAPAHAREDLKAGLQEDVRKAMTAKGVARHSEAEIVALGVRSLNALDLFLGGKPYLMGDEPVGADAFVFAVLAGTMTPHFSSPLRDEALKFPNLVAYVARMMERFFPDFDWTAGFSEARQAA